MDLDAVYRNDVVGDLAGAGTKAHDDMSAGLMFDQHPAVQADCVVHEFLPLRPIPTTIRWCCSGQLGS